MLLSMGMSGDYELAIRLGSGNVRVGSTIFGARPAKVVIARCPPRHTFPGSMLRKRSWGVAPADGTLSKTAAVAAGARSNVHSTRSSERSRAQARRPRRP